MGDDIPFLVMEHLSKDVFIAGWDQYLFNHLLVEF